MFGSQARRVLLLHLVFFGLGTFVLIDASVNLVYWVLWENAWNLVWFLLFVGVSGGLFGFSRGLLEKYCFMRKQGVG